MELLKFVEQNNLEEFKNNLDMDSIEEVDKCESLEGLPATISNGKLTLHLERDYAEPKYYRWKAKLEVE